MELIDGFWFFGFCILILCLFHISFCWTFTVVLLPNRFMINYQCSYRQGKQFSLS